jgi:hypothetical protein
VGHRAHLSRGRPGPRPKRPACSPAGSPSRRRSPAAVAAGAGPGGRAGRGELRHAGPPARAARRRCDHRHHRDARWARRRPGGRAPSVPGTPAATPTTSSARPTSTPWSWPPATTRTRATWSAPCGPASTCSWRSRWPSTAAQLASLRACIAGAGRRRRTRSRSWAWASTGGSRRSPVRMAELLATRSGPKALTLTMNAGAIPSEPLDPGPGRGRRPPGGRGLPPSSTSPGSWWGRPSSAWPASGSTSPARAVPPTPPARLLTVRRRLDRHRQLLRQRLQALSQGARRGLQRGPRPRQRQLPHPAGLRLARGAHLPGAHQDKGHAAGMAAFVAAVRAGGPATDPASPRSARGERGLAAGLPALRSPSR